MSDRADVLRLPDGLDEVAAKYWRDIAPTLWKQGLLTSETRDDIEWLSRLHGRTVALQLRAVDENRDEESRRADRLEVTKLLSVCLRLSHRYALTPRGRVEMERRGWPGTPNPISDWLLDEDEKG